MVIGFLRNICTYLPRKAIGLKSNCFSREIRMASVKYVDEYEKTFSGPPDGNFWIRIMHPNYCKTSSPLNRCAKHTICENTPCKIHRDRRTFDLSYSQRYSEQFLRSKIVSEYDQEIPKSQTADKPMAPRGRASHFRSN